MSPDTALKAITLNGLAILYSYFLWFHSVAVLRVELVQNTWEELDLDIILKTLWKFLNKEEHRTIHCLLVIY